MGNEVYFVVHLPCVNHIHSQTVLNLKLRNEWQLCARVSFLSSGATIQEPGFIRQAVKPIQFSEPRRGGGGVGVGGGVMPTINQSHTRASVT